MSDWQTALREAADVLAGRTVTVGHAWCSGPASGQATVGLFVGDGTLQVVFTRDAGTTRWRVLFGSRQPVWDWRSVIAVCLANYRREGPLALRAVESWCST